MARIVILGGSFGGLTAAFELRRLLGSRADITLVSDSEDFVFIPSLPWVAMGWRKARDISVPLRPVLSRKAITFAHEEAVGVDADAKKVVTKTGEYPYDYLVIATGPSLAFAEVPGLGPENGNSDCIFTLPQALKANAAWERFLQSPGPIAVGSVQGVSCFGPAYEYAFELDAELRRRGIRHKVPMHFITSEPYAGHFGLGGFGASRHWMEQEFADKDIKVLTGQSIEEITPGEVRLKGGVSVPFKLAMFGPAMKGVTAVAHLGNPRGFIPVDGSMRHTKHKEIFVVGVAVAIAPPEPTAVPTGVPKTGYMTVRMAKKAAEAIAREVTGRPAPAPYKMDIMCIMDMGRKAALMASPQLLPPRERTILKTGRSARWLKLALERWVLYKIRHGGAYAPFTRTGLRKTQ